MNKQDADVKGVGGGIAKLLLVCLFPANFPHPGALPQYLEVKRCTHLQFFGGASSNDDTLFVHLQGADSPHLHHGTLDCTILGQRAFRLRSIITSRASSTKPTPAVRAVLGTWFTPLSKKRSWQADGIGSQCLLGGCVTKG